MGLLFIPICAQSTDANHDLDFWLGRWKVYVGNELVGEDVVEASMNGFVVVERWTGAAGDKGTSFFYYMPDKKCWKQVWATEVGIYKEKVSEPWPEGIRFVGQVHLPSGKSFSDRTTLTRRPDGAVHQVIERQVPAGTWEATFDAIYRKAEE